MSGTSKMNDYVHPSNTARPFKGMLEAGRWVIVPAAVLTLLLLVMAYAAVSGSSFGAAMSSIWADPWGKAVVMDVYAGLILVGAWIAWREPTFGRTSCWWLALALTGNIATCLYILFALRDSNGSAQRFFCGPGR